MRVIPWVKSWRGVLAGLTSLTLLSGCLSESTEPEEQDLGPVDQILLSGSVGDGPVVGASLTVATANGDVIASLTSDTSAGYSVTIDTPDAVFPLVVTATGGTDLVTNLAPDFMLRGAALSGVEHVIANVNPFTTLAVEVASEIGGELSTSNLSTAEDLTVHALDTGLTSLLASGTLATEIDETNVAEIVRASEALAEIVRRTRDFLASTGDAVVSALASDLVDGVIEGNGGNNVDPRTAAVASLVATLVRLETMSNSLRVNGADATSAMVAATEQVSPVPPNPTIQGLAVTEGMLRETRIGLSAAWEVSKDPRIADIANAVDSIRPGMNSGFAASLLPAGYRTALNDVIMLVAYGDMGQVDLVNSVVRSGGSAIVPGNNAPMISGAPTPSVAAGESYSFRPTASDPDGDSLVFSVSNQPAWASFDTSTGRVFGTPGAGDVGSYLDIVITATDGDLDASLGPFTINVTAGNRAPTISGTGSATLDIGEAYEFTPTAADPDGDNLTFSIVNRPAWAVLDAATGRLSGTPGSGDSGTYRNIIIRVSDGQLTSSLAAFSITVIATNDPPTIGGTPAAEVTAGTPYGFTPSASDINGDPLIFSVDNRPAWASFDPATGQLSGNPDAGDVGSYLDIVITVSDGELSAVLGPFTINVIVDNRPPGISGSGAATLDVGEPYTFTPTASDPDGDPLTFSIVNRPSWASFDTTAGTLSGTPGVGDARSYSNIIIRASDGDLTTSLPAFSITVLAPNTAPTIGGTPNPLATVGTPYSFTPTASDAENDVLTFSISGKPVWATFSGANGQLTGTPGSGHVGTYNNIRITVSDGNSSAVLGPFSITVEAGNRAPTIGGTPASSVTANSTYLFTPNASDPDGDTLSFSISGRPTWAQFSAGNGTLSGTPGNGDIGTYPGILITVSDGTASSTLGPFSITVVASNRAPTIGGSPAASVTANAPYSFTPNASDPDGDTLTFSISGKPNWAQFSAGSGTLAGTPGNGDAGTYSGIRITVSDGNASATLGPFSITVVAANRAPTIGGSPAASVTANSGYTFTPNASDPDGDTLAFSISGMPGWAQFSAGNGTLSGTPDNGDVGTYSGIRITVSDGNASATLGPFSIQVVAGNGAPSIGGSPATSVNANSGYSFTPNASDPDGDTLTFSISGMPSWARFDADDGTLSGTPDDGDVGVYTGIRITVTDGQASATLGPFSVTVNALSNGTVTLSWTAPTENTDGSTLTDLAGYTIYWRTAPGAYPNSVRINNPSVTTYVLDNLSPGNYEFVVTAFNNDNMESSYSNTASKTVP